MESHDTKHTIERSHIAMCNLCYYMPSDESGQVVVQKNIAI